MFKQKSAVKDVNELINNKSHIQKKYFSLMLVPSFSSGKTRSVRIPYTLFYFVIISVLVVSAAILGFYMRSSYYARAAMEAGASLNEAQAAYSKLQANLEDEQSRFLDGQNELKEQLTEAEIRSQTEKSKQSKDYQNNLEDLKQQVEDMERSLQELDVYRQEALDQLSASTYIPPVKTLFDEVNNKLSGSQVMFLSSINATQISSDERSAAYGATEQDLLDYFTIFDLKKEALAQSFTELEEAAAKAKPYISNYPTIKPVDGQISSEYGNRTNPMGGRGREFHDALDIRCKTGTDVKAAGGGTVLSAGWLGSYGYIVVIDHGFGIQTAYAHNSKLLVSAGDKVERGDIISKSGSTGRSTGPHLHYEVRINGVTTDPGAFFLA